MRAAAKTEKSKKPLHIGQQIREALLTHGAEVGLDDDDDDQSPFAPPSKLSCVHVMCGGVYQT